MTVIKNRAMLGGKPSEILRDVNDSLCERNEELMFVTVWLGILTLSTGVLIEANAGHEYPAVRTGGGDYSIIDLPHGIVLGAQSGTVYTDDSVTLRKGDSLFVYTDGLTDASNENDEMFGIERVISSLNEIKEEGPKELLSGISGAVNSFVGAAKQFDDLTMLVIRYDGAKDTGLAR